MKNKSVSYNKLNPLNISRWTVLLLIIFGFTIAANAQNSKGLDIAPPPLTIISDGERDQLKAETDIKNALNWLWN